jgi:AcrR family transcriptional regulator
MATEGTSSLNLRAVAREMGMTPSALYRYFPSRDAILTALITDAYDAVGEAVERAVEEAQAREAEAGEAAQGTVTSMLAAVHTFRRWAVDHPQEFGLIYGSPVPGYEAPEEETVDAAMRTSHVLLTQLERGVAQGLVRLPDDETVPPELREAVLHVAAHKGHDLTVAGAAVAMQFWLVLLGALSAEVFGHVPAALVQQGEAFFDHTMRQALLAIGVERSAVERAVSPPPRS